MLLFIVLKQEDSFKLKDTYTHHQPYFNLASDIKPLTDREKSEEMEDLLIQNRKFSIENFDQGMLMDTDPKILLAKGPIFALSRWKELNGEFIWRECVIEEFIAEKSAFRIQWLHNSQKKLVKRLNLMLENENQTEFLNRCNLAEKTRDRSLLNQAKKGS